VAGAEVSRIDCANRREPRHFLRGIVGESKMATLKELFLTSPKFTAEAELIVGDALVARLRSLDEIRTRLGIDFPFILKPTLANAVQASS